MKKNKVCFFINDMTNSGGTERVTTTVANALVQRGYDISILTIKPIGHSFFTLLPEINIHSLELNPTGMSIINRGKIIIGIRKYVRQNHINHFISVDSLLNIYATPALFMTKAKNICWEHFSYKIDLGVKLRRFSRYLAGMFADDIVVLSMKDKENWEKNLHFLNANIHVIYNPITYAISSSCYDTDSKIVLAVGRLRAEKGMDQLLHIWKKTSSHHHDWKLIIAGDGPDKQMLAKLVKDLELSDSVRFLGAVKNVNELYQNASIFCLTSRFEGFGMALAEAQTFGIPSIAFDCECGPSEILNCDNGVLIPTENTAQFSSALLTLIENVELRKKMSINARTKAQEFTVDKVIATWENYLLNKDL